jgi:hypothetical protein
MLARLHPKLQSASSRALFESLHFSLELLFEAKRFAHVSMNCEEGERKIERERERKRDYK